MKGEKSRLGHLLRIFHFAMNGPGSNFFPVDTDCCLSFCCLSFFFSFPCLVVPTSRQGGGFCAAFFWGDCTPSPLWYQATKQPSNRQRGRASLSLSLSFLWCPLWGGLGCTSLVPFTQAWYPSSKQPGNRQRGRPPPPLSFFPFLSFLLFALWGRGLASAAPPHRLVHQPWRAPSVSQSVRQAGGRAVTSQCTRFLSSPSPSPSLSFCSALCASSRIDRRDPLSDRRDTLRFKREKEKKKPPLCRPAATTATTAATSTTCAPQRQACTRPPACCGQGIQAQKKERKEEKEQRQEGGGARKAGQRASPPRRGMRTHPPPHSLSPRRPSGRTGMPVRGVDGRDISPKQ